MFEVTIDGRRKLLHIVMQGFWNDDTMARYSEIVVQKSSELRRAEGCKRILINMSDFPIQSKKIAEGHAAFLRTVRDRGEARVALVMQSALSKLQAARVASDTGHSTFADEAEALAWLMEDELPVIINRPSA
ncbi:hypothetical protein [Sphingomonas sp. PB4P5]|uniref:hypothetical protein n=1 Tax=Parasphingomonas puruogangriensis TaxID=3096155 RepID=UPI002FC9CCA2